jgi:hypothetical protein
VSPSALLIGLSLLLPGEPTTRRDEVKCELLVRSAAWATSDGRARIRPTDDGTFSFSLCARRLREAGHDVDAPVLFGHSFWNVRLNQNEDRATLVRLFQCGMPCGYTVEETWLRKPSGWLRSKSFLIHVY